MVITAAAGRNDQSQASDVTWTNSDFRLTLSTTTNDDLSTTFEENIGTDATVVFEGSSTQTRLATGPDGGPHPFGTGIRFQTPFVYDPTQGNLLFDFVTFSGDDIGAEVDFQSTSHIGTVFSLDPNASVGSSAQTVQLRQFTFVPEPSSVAFSAAAVIVLFMRQRPRLAQRS